MTELLYQLNKNGTVDIRMVEGQNIKAAV